MSAWASSKFCAFLQPYKKQASMVTSFDKLVLGVNECLIQSGFLKMDE